MTTTVDSADPGLSRALRRRGALVLAVFAPLWSLVAISGLAPDTRGPARIVAVLITVTTAVVALRPDHPSARERLRVLPEGWHRRVGVVNAAEFAAIAGTVAVLVVADQPQLVPPVVCAIVGLHFLPLSRLFDQPEYRGTAAGLLVTAAVGLAIALHGPSDETSRVVVGACAAGTLWATSLLLSRGGWRSA